MSSKRFDFRELAHEQELNRAFTDLADVLANSGVAAIADVVPGLRARLKLEPRAEPQDPFTFQLEEMTYDNVIARCTTENVDLKRVTLIQGDRFFVEANLQPQGNQTWRQIACASSVDIHQEAAALSFIDSKKKLVDWPSTMDNLQKLARIKLYSEAMMKACLIKFVNHYESAQTEYLKDKTSNEIARFLISLSTRVDKKAYHKARLLASVRLPEETLSAAVLKVKNIVDVLYGADRPAAAVGGARAGDALANNNQAAALPAAQAAPADALLENNGLANRILINAVIAFVKDDIAIPLQEKVLADNARNRLRSFNDYMELAMHAEVRGSSYPTVPMKYNRKLVQVSDSVLSLNSIYVPEIHPCMRVPQKKIFGASLQNYFGRYYTPDEAEAPLLDGQLDPVDGVGNLIPMFENEQILPDVPVVGLAGPAPAQVAPVNPQVQPAQGPAPLQPIENLAQPQAGASGQVYQPTPRVLGPNAIGFDIQEPLPGALPAQTSEDQNIATRIVVPRTLVPKGAVLYRGPLGQCFYENKNKIYVEREKSPVSTGARQKIKKGVKNDPLTRASDSEHESDSDDLYSKINNIVAKTLSEQLNLVNRPRTPSNDRNASQNSRKTDYRPTARSEDKSHSYNSSSQRDNTRFNSRSPGNMNRNSSPGGGYQNNDTRPRSQNNQRYSNSQGSLDHRIRANSPNFNRSNNNGNRSQSPGSRNNNYSGSFTRREPSRENSPWRSNYSSNSDNRDYRSASSPNRDRRDNRYYSNNRDGVGYQKSGNNYSGRNYSPNRRDISRDRSLEAKRTDYLDDKVQKSYPNMQRGKNCSPNYNPLLSKKCTKCENKTTHHEFECRKYRDFNHTRCKVCDLYYHKDEHCKEVPKYPPKSASSNSLETEKN